MNKKFVVEIRAYNVFEDEFGEIDELQLDSTSVSEYDTLEDAKEALEYDVNHNYCFGMWIKAYINCECYVDDMKLL